MTENTLLDLEEQGIDIKKWLMLFIRHWLLFLICIVLALSITGIAILCTPVQYELSSNVLVNKENNPLDKGQLFSSAFYSDPYQLENEKGILISKSVTRNAIRNLDFDVSYYLKKRPVKIELYKNSPFTVHFDTSRLQPLGVEFHVRIINDTLLYLEALGENVLLYDFSSDQERNILSEFFFTDTVHYGEITGNAYCRFSIIPNYQFISDELSAEDYYFQFFSQKNLIATFRNFKIENERASSILRITARYTNPQKSADFLNELLRVYLLRGVERDNKIAKATIRFIDAQLIELVDSLQVSGSRLQDFRSSKKVIDIGFQAEKVYSKLEKLEANKAKLLVKRKYFSYLIQNLQSKSDVNELISPASFEINDPLLNNLLVELAGLYTDRSEMQFNSIKDNPYLNSLELKINDARRKILHAVRNLLEATELTIEDIESQIKVAERTLDRLPRDQQRLLNIERKFKLNDEIYTYLLTRRSEMEIFKASNIPVNEILDVADEEDSIKVSPNVRLNLLVGLLLGIFFPGVLIYFRESMNTRIRNREDINRFTNYPLLGQIVETKYTEFPVVLKEPNSVIAESYRTLRTNMQFIINESVSNTILVTSAIQGEGKSFTALNLASVYAYYGKKTILVDFDLRKSRIKANLNIKQDIGLSNYLSKNCPFNEIISKTDGINFDVLLAGPAPPNPSELVASDLTSDLLTKLKGMYDIVVIDSPPIGIVSDALLLYPKVDITLLVVRYNYTSCEIFDNLVHDLNSRKIEKINIILNDVQLSNSQYGYGYGYVGEGKNKWNRWSGKKNST